MRCLALLALVAACASGPDVRSNYDKSYSFEGKQTFGWVPSKPSGDPQIDDAMLEKNVRDAVTRELNAKGYVLALGDDADFRIAHFAVAQKESANLRDDPGLYYGRGDATTGPGGEYVYLTATLILEVQDGKGGPVVWSARARDAVFVKARKQQRRRKTSEAVRKMLADFPSR